MKESNLKNMVVLKNLPSNLVEEAIVILKSNTKVKKLQKVEKNKITEYKNNEKKDKDYILKEAEMLVSNYISNIEEEKNKKEMTNKKASKKYKRLKKYAYISSFVILVQAIMLIIK